MALGTVNVPSVSGHELDDIRAVANTAKEVASAAQNTADGAKSTAEAGGLCAAGGHQADQLHQRYSLAEWEPDLYRLPAEPGMEQL